MIEFRTPKAGLAEGLAHVLLGYQLAQASVVTDRIYDEQAVADGLRRVEYTLLSLVHANPGVTARQLAQALAVTPPHVALCLERLQGRALIERERSEQDGRVQHLRSTEAGAQRLQALTQRLAQAEQAALQPVLSRAERDLLVELLHKLAQARGPKPGR